VNATTPLEALREIVDGDAWLVGGALRDRLLGRSTADFDVAAAGEARAFARALARRMDAHVFSLSEVFGSWRVIARDRTWQVDILPLVGGTIESDLAKRDFTVNAIAEPLHGSGYVDPFGGLRDLQDRRLRMVSASAFADDPLRAIRLARLACELSFDAEPDTLAAARAHARDLDSVAPERIFAELGRIISSDDALQGLELMDRAGATEVVLPELAELQGVEQSHYHHLDVYEHTRAVLGKTIELERDPGRWFASQGEAISRLLSEPLANELTRAQALRFGALLHDIAKPQTRRVTSEGRVTFMGHDDAGAALSLAILGRLRASERLGEYVAALTRHHLQLGFLVHQTPLSRRAIYGYLRACDPVQVDVTLLSVADRLATRGRGSRKAIAKHLELARVLLIEAFAWREAPPRPPIRGDDLARMLAMRPGPELGRILAELEAASFAGEIDDRDQAIERAREFIGRGALQSAEP